MCIRDRLKPTGTPVFIYCHSSLFLKYKSTPLIPVSGIWSILKLLSTSHFAVITDEFERNLIDNPDECFDKSQTGSLTISLYEAGNLSYLFSFKESWIKVPSKRNESSP